MKRSKTSIFSCIWKSGIEGCSKRERYIDLPDNIAKVSKDCICAQICAFNDTGEVIVYILHYPESESDNWGEFVYLSDLPMKCVEDILEHVKKI